MKRRHRVLLLVLAAALAILFIVTTCAPPEEDPPVSMRDRMSYFKNDLNNDRNRTYIYHNLHPDKQPAYRDPSAWSGTLSYANHAFDYKDEVIEASADDTVGTIEAYFMHAFDRGMCIVHMKKDGSDWYIDGMVWQGTELFP